MSNFTKQGDGQYDFFALNGNIDLAIVPANSISNFKMDLPIRLQHGTATWGFMHIDARHRHWVERQNASIPEFVYRTLGKPGTIYSTEQRRKIAAFYTANPSTLMILRHSRHQTLGEFLTVVTVFGKPNSPDGDIIGRYRGDFRL